MSNENNGEQAFPHYPSAGYAPGMTLRDYFAANVTVPHDDELSLEWQVALAGRKYPDGSGIDERMQWEFDWRAAYKLRLADAILKARKS